MNTSQLTPFQMSNFRVIKHVTRPLLKLVDNQPAYVKVDGAFKQAEQQKKPKMVKQADGSEVPQPPPFVVDVTNLENNQPSTMVANEVFRTELQKQYPNDTYVGKYFEVIKNTKAEGKNYNTFGITEIAPVETEAPKAGEPAKVAATTAKK